MKKLLKDVYMANIPSVSEQYLNLLERASDLYLFQQLEQELALIKTMSSLERVKSLEKMAMFTCLLAKRLSDNLDIQIVEPKKKRRKLTNG
jgi:hypothetical protein